MSLVIRLARTGKKGERKFRVVVMEKRSRRDGKPVETLGWYEKTEKGQKTKLNRERINYWLSRGAQSTPTVSKLVNI